MLIKPIVLWRCRCRRRRPCLSSLLPYFKGLNFELLVFFQDCSLQIHNRFSASRFVEFAQGPLSVPNAVGIIIVHANAGVALTKRTDIWMSRDGGYSWYKVRSIVMSSEH